MESPWIASVGTFTGYGDTKSQICPVDEVTDLGRRDWESLVYEQLLRQALYSS
jgi:hypothetical protein